jgi:carbon monoxide dehydrogenase subunit G
MQIAGTLALAAPPRHFVAALQRADVLGTILPGYVRVEESGAAQLRLTVTRTIAGVALRVPVTLDFTPGEAPHRLSLTARGSALMAGAVTLDLAVAGRSQVPGEGHVDWQGTLAARGLLAQVSRGQEERVNAMVAQAFGRLARRVEDTWQKRRAEEDGRPVA